MKRRNFVSVVLIVVVLLLGSVRVWGHAVVVESTPKMNDVISGPTLQIKVRFNSRIDGKRSRLTLVVPDGRSRGIDLARQVTPDSMLATVSDLIPGKYQLHWQVLASDGHITEGNIPFSVVAP